MNINSKITSGLHPDNVTAIDGYDDETKPYLNATLEAFSAAYCGLDAIHNARAAAKKNPAWNEASQVLQVAQFAEKQQAAMARKFDSALAGLNKGIEGIEDMLTSPLQHAASTGTISPEIRAHVKALSTDKRYEFLKAAQDAGDTTTLCAVLGAPAFLSGMTQIDRDLHTRLYHERRAPEAAKRLNVMKKARDLIYDRSVMIFPETEKAVGASFSKVQMLRKARDEAERAFIVRDVQ